MEIDYNVVKSNDIVQRASYSLSAMEQKLLLYVISKIKPTDTDLQDYSFRMIDLVSLFGLDKSNKSREQIWTAFRNLRKKEIEVDTKEKKFICGWLNDVVLWHDDLQTVTVGINRNLKPYLLALSEQYTIYQLRQILTMKSRYSIRLYELCKSHLAETYFSVETKEIKKMLQTDYRWADLKTKILDVAKEEINAKSDLLVDFTPIRTGRKYTAIRFKVIQKDRATALRTQAEQESKLYGYDK